MADCLLLADVGQPRHLGLGGDGLEPVLDATGADRLNYLADVVADYAEPSALAVVLDDPAQGGLRVVGHRVRLVEHDQLEGGQSGHLGDHGLAEVLDLVPDDPDAPLAGGVHLQHAFLAVLTEQLPGQRQDS